MPTKTRPLARFGYLAFAPLLFFSCNSGFSPQSPPHRARQPHCF
ncbi:hypothetical protein ACK39T_08915 [Aeromonas veronii]